MELFILFFLIVLFLYSTRENYVNYIKLPKDKKCLSIKYPYIDPIFKTDNHIKPQIYNNKHNYYVRNYTKGEINEILKTIPLNKTNTIYKELSDRTNVDYKRVSHLFNYLQTILLTTFKKDINSNLSKLHCAGLSNCNPQIINKKIIKIQHNNDNYHFTVHLELLIKSKSYSIILLIAVEFNNNIYLINSIKFDGIKFTDKIYLLPGLDVDHRYIDIYNNDDVPYKANNDYLKLSTEEKILFSKTSVKKRSINDQLFYTTKSCYGKHAFNQNECELGYNLYGEKVEKGVWK
uniref:Uncharacterized protein n=1 Tax=viral metagenome TaxID=1070528 RepID=A0A6C0EJF7_9ZZZZ